MRFWVVASGCDTILDIDVNLSVSFSSMRPQVGTIRCNRSILLEKMIFRDAICHRSVDLPSTLPLVRICWIRVAILGHHEKDNATQRMLAFPYLKSEIDFCPSSLAPLFKSVPARRDIFRVWDL